MKNIIIKNFKIITLAIAITAITSTFAAPVSDFVRTEGTAPQVKLGDLLVSAFTANKDATFYKDTTFEGNILGKPPVSGNVYSLNLSSPVSGKFTSVSVNGDTYINDGSLTVSNIQPYTIITAPVKICTDSTGQVSKCVYTPAITSFTATLSTPTDVISWTSVNTKYCIGNFFVTAGKTSGSASVPSERLSRGTTLKLTCVGLDSTVTKSSTL